MHPTSKRGAGLELTLDLERLAADLRGPGWHVEPQALARQACERLRAEADAEHRRGAFRAAGVGRGGAWQLRPELRRDQVLWIDPSAATPLQGELLQAFERLRLAINERLWLGLADYEAHLALYPPGSFYKRHSDHFAGTEERLLTTTLYLNADWRPADGGRIRLFVPRGEPVEIAPAGGTLLVFLAQEFDHEVLTARRERWSWTGWFKQRA